MPITIISVAKSYSNRGNHQHRPGTKKNWYVYYLDEEGNFKTSRVNALEALLCKAIKCHRYRYVCPDCRSQMIAFVRSLKQEVRCANCEYITSLEDINETDLEFLPKEDNEEDW